MLEKILSKLFLNVDILKGNNVYLRRWFLGYHSSTDFTASPPRIVVKWYHRFINRLFKRADTSELYLHKMFLSDDDRDPHDHPWPFETTVLWNGYNDESYHVVPTNSYTAKRLRVPLEFTREGPFKDGLRFLSNRKRPATWCHQVKKHNDSPTWTLVRRGEYDGVREWGFTLDTGLWVPWRQYLNEWAQGNPYDPMEKQ